MKKHGKMENWGVTLQLILGGALSVENYLGYFLEKLQKIWKSTKNYPSNKGARFARPFCWQFVVLFPYFSIFQKNGPGSFPHSLCPLSQFRRAHL